MKNFFRLFFQNSKSLLHFSLFIHISHNSFRQLIILIDLFLIVIIKLSNYILILPYLLLRQLQLLIILLGGSSLSYSYDFIF